MATDLANRPAAADDLGIDREFLMMLARIPFFAAGWMLAAWIGQQISPLVPVALLCGGMILAAVIDGVKFKVPNWLTLSLILSGLGLGILNSYGVTIGPGPIDPSGLEPCIW